MPGNTKPDVDQLLMDGFKTLAKKQPVEKITIKDITDEAGVIRPTFYNHFQDKYEVIERIIKDEIYAPSIPLFQLGMYKEALLLMLKNIEIEKEFYMKISRMEGQNSFADIVRDGLTKFLLSYIVPRLENKKTMHVWMTPELLASYYAYSFSFVVIRWIQSGMSISAEEVEEIYHYMMTRSIEDIMHEIENS